MRIASCLTTVANHAAAVSGADPSAVAQRDLEAAPERLPGVVVAQRVAARDAQERPLDRLDAQRAGMAGHAAPPASRLGIGSGTAGLSQTTSGAASRVRFPRAWTC